MISFSAFGLECVWPKFGLNDFSVDVGNPTVPTPIPPAPAQNVPTVTIPPATLANERGKAIDLPNPLRSVN